MSDALLAALMGFGLGAPIGAIVTMLLAMPRPA